MVEDIFLSLILILMGIVIVVYVITWIKLIFEDWDIKWPWKREGKVTPKLVSDLIEAYMKENYVNCSECGCLVYRYRAYIS